MRARLVTDRDARLADGVVVAADVRARLFGVRLLRLTAEVVMVPASVRSSTVWAEPDHVSGNGRHAPVVRLADAQQLLRDSDTLLSRAREISG